MYIFDLDGTLYEGSAHFDYYADLIKQELPAEWQHAFTREYEKMKAGEHAVKIGRAYDPVLDQIVEVDPFTKNISAVYTWDGTPVTGSAYEGKAAAFDVETLAAIGDGWWYVYACAKHFGAENIEENYQRTKEYMASEKFDWETIDGLPQFLQELRQHSALILVTNSDLEDASRILKELGLGGIFHEIHSSAGKPKHTERIFQKIVQMHKKHPENVYAVGDNFINDVAPALALGMQGVLISPEKTVREHPNLTQVKQLKDWTALHQAAGK